jgi:hypothetical protein
MYVQPFSALNSIQVFLLAPTWVYMLVLMLCMFSRNHLTLSHRPEADELKSFMIPHGVTEPSVWRILKQS